MTAQDICCDFAMSEHHLGGDDVVAYVEATLTAIEEGYKVLTWYDEETNVLIVGIKPDTLNVVEKYSLDTVE